MTEPQVIQQHNKKSKSRLISSYHLQISIAQYSNMFRNKHQLCEVGVSGYNLQSSKFVCKTRNLEEFELTIQ